jgi:internalin A
MNDLKNLATIMLNGTQVTDAGLKELKNLKNLTWLDVSLTKVTDMGVKQLNKALPGCHILSYGLKK